MRPIACLILLLACADLASAQLRVATWNISYYSGGRISDIHTSVYAEFEGRSMRPDIIVTQEFFGTGAAVNDFLFALNTAPGSPGDWEAAPFMQSRVSSNAAFYRASKIELLGWHVVSEGSVPGHPRDINRFDFRPVGYEASETIFALYVSHMKAGSSSTDQQRRLDEAIQIRADVETLPEGWSFMLAGDFNIQSSQQAAYQHLTGASVDPAVRFYDPIKTPGSWNNNGAYRFVHTQDPIGPGGMDDRYDQILVSGSLINHEGLSYIGDASIPYSTTTWDDPNHSYRSWGNDGTTYKQNLRVEGNAMVGPVIAQALIDMAVGAGHLPVYLDLRVPAKIDADGTIDFGRVALGAPAEIDLTVAHAGDLSRWTAAGLDDLRYAFDAPSGIIAPSDPFVLAPGAAAEHTIALDTSEPGEIDTTLLILSGDPDAPALPVRVLASIGPVCIADMNGDGVVDADDFFLFLSLFAAGDSRADINADGIIDADDFFAFLTEFAAGC